MKRFCRVTLVFLLLVLLSVPAFAAETRYVPELPPFLNADGSLNIPIDKDSTPGLREFFANFYDGPYLVLVEQWNAYGSEDKQWHLTFVKILTSTVSAGIGGFEFTGGTNGSTSNGGGYYIAPVRYHAPSAGYRLAFYRYDFKTNTFLRPSVGGGMSGQSVSPITFAYVVDSSPLSGTSKEYPYHNTLDGTHPFEVNYAVERHYDWWLNIKSDITPPKDPDLNLDTDDDGIPDTNVDTNGDGKPDINEDTNGDKKPDINIDTNGDGKPDTNVDTNGDKKPDINVDTNGDGKPDTNVDTNGDKKPDINIDTNGDGKPDTNVDTNGDGKPDINVDTNGDKKPDINIDTNGDGKPDTNVDTNGDKKPDINVDTNGDGKPDINIDKDGNNKPDVNIDTNGDKKPDINIDTNGDGKPDVNVDSDGDGKPDTNVKPDGGGSGGSSGGDGGNPDGGFGDDWFEPDSNDYTYNDFPIFNPFDYDYTPPSYGNPFTDYDPLKDHEFSYMPEIPRPEIPPWNGYNPFINPYK